MAAKSSMGIRAKFVFMLGTFGVVALIVLGWGSYSFSVQRSISEAKSKGELIFSYIKSSQNFFQESQRPLIMELVEKERFYPELMSGFAITRGTWDLIKDGLGGYRFKQASFDPLWKHNKADLEEEKIINKFRDNRKMKTAEGRITKNGKMFYYIAEPVEIKSKSCLRCHGNVRNAPKDQVEIYGTDHGYNWKLGEIVSANIVYVPLTDAINAGRKTAMLLFAAGAALMLVSLLGIWFFLDKRVVKPIMELGEMAGEISIGKNLDREVSSPRMHDEIATLAKSVDRLRISMVKMLKRRKRD